jgi:hypothetical protein
MMGVMCIWNAGALSVYCSVGVMLENFSVTCELFYIKTDAAGKFWLHL